MTAADYLAGRLEDEARRLEDEDGALGSRDAARMLREAAKMIRDQQQALTEAGEHAEASFRRGYAIGSGEEEP